MKDLVEGRDRGGADETFDGAQLSQASRARTGKIIDERKNSPSIIASPHLGGDLPIGHVPGQIEDEQVWLPGRLEYQRQFLERNGE